MRAVLALFEKCVKTSKNLPEDHYIAAMNVEDPGRLADLVASSLDLSVAQAQNLLESFDPAERLQRSASISAVSWNSRSSKTTFTRRCNRRSIVRSGSSSCASR